ncbi:MAG: hypothetical protein ACRENE_07125, partial [Polyangiaceae bacterium]
LDEPHVRAAGVVGALAVAVATARGPWASDLHQAHEYQDDRSDLHRALARHAGDRGILKTVDEIAVAAAFDPWGDGAERIFVVDDGSGVLELRRAHPELPLLVALPHDEVGRLYARAPPPGLLVELERAWPTFVRPEGLGASRWRNKEASGGFVLRLAHAHPGSSVVVPFEIASRGAYAVRVDGFTGPSGGDYALALDGEPLPPYRGFSPGREPRKGDSVERALTEGRHTLVATCTGHDARSTAFDAELDAIAGEVRSGPAGEQAPASVAAP